MPKSYNSDLFLLIKNMEPSEKRYFKLYASNNTQHKKNKYILLFEAIEKQKKFDEVPLLKAKFITQLPQLKSRLYDLVLKSLRSYHGEKSIENELRSEAEYIDILIQKKLFVQANKIIKKAKQKALYHEKHWHQMYFSICEIDLDTQQALKGISDGEIKQKYKSLYQQLEVFKNIIEYKNAKTYFHKYYIERTGDALSSLKNLMNNSIMKHYDKAISPFTQEIFLNLNSIYYSLLGDTKAAYDYNLRLVSLMENRKGITQEDPLNYAKYIQNSIGYQMELKIYEGLFDSIKKVRQLKFKNLADHVHVNALLNSMELAIYGSLVDFDSAAKLLTNHEKLLLENNNYVQRETLIIFYFNAAVIYFGKENYKQSNIYLNKIINDNSLDNTRTDLHCMVRIIKLLIYYELQKQDLLEYSIKNSYRYLNKWKHLSPLYETLLLFLKNKIHKINTYKEQIASFVILKKELELVVKNYGNNQTGFNIIAWLESKINKKPFAEVIRDSQKQK